MILTGECFSIDFPSSARIQSLSSFFINDSDFSFVRGSKPPSQGTHFFYQNQPSLPLKLFILSMTVG